MTEPVAVLRLDEKTVTLLLDALQCRHNALQKAISTVQGLLHEGLLPSEAYCVMAPETNEYANRLLAVKDDLQHARNKAHEALLATIIEPEWIVNSLGELGVKLGERCFFLYKARNLEYSKKDRDEDSNPLMWRPVYKREFGECCYPPTEPHRDRGVVNKDGTYTFGNKEDWQPIPPKGGAK